MPLRRGANALGATLVEQEEGGDETACLPDRREVLLVCPLLTWYSSKIEPGMAACR